jgi:PTH1 family peptidyl-tRNA hydrolase
MISLFIGLGNPGKKYEMTRHNMGFMVLTDLSKRLRWDFKEKKQFSAWVAKGDFEGKTIHLLMPTTFMNASGQAVRDYMDYIKLPVNELLVVVDDIALPYGTMRLRSKGSAGGHNGLKSIAASLGTQEYARLRLGIGFDNKQDDLANYVLDSFNCEEKKNLPEYIQRGTQVLIRLIKENMDHVMKTMNRPLA